MRTLICIDGGYVAKAYVGKLDFKELSKQVGGNLVRMIYYDCMPVNTTEEDQPRFDAKHRMLTALSYIPRMQVKLGQLKMNGDGKYVQKQVDCQIVADIVAFACKGKVDRIVVITADTDIIPGLKVARSEGCVVELWVCEGSNVTKELREEIDEQKVIPTAHNGPSSYTFLGNNYAK